MRPETIEAVRALVNAFGYEQTERTIAKYRDELTSPDARWLLEQQLPRHAETSREHRVIATRLRALERCIEVGPAATFAGYPAAAETIGAIVNGRDWDEIRAVIDANRHHVLADVADVAFADLVMQPLDAEDESQVLGAWALVRQSRLVGVDAAIEQQRQPRRGFIISAGTAAELAKATSDAELQQQFSAVPDVAERVARQKDGAAQLAAWDGWEEYAATIAALIAPGEAAKRIEVARGALATIDRDALPIVWALIALDLADALRTQHATSDVAPMAEPITLYREAIARLTPHGEPDQYVHANRYLGDAYLQDSDGDQASNAARAVEHYEVALGMLRPRVETIPWATVASHLAEALLRRAHGDPTVDVERAIALLEEAISILEKTDEGALRAAARMTLAAALTARVSDSPDANLRAAARHLRDAAEDVDPAEHPDVWTMARANLGVVYLSRARTDPADGPRLRRQAEAQFREALRRQDAGWRPLARAHVGLGWALSDMHDRGPANGAEAIAHYEAAIALYKAAGPALDAERGSAIRNLAITHAERAEKDTSASLEAERQFRAALGIFSPDGYPAERRDTLRPMGAMYFSAGRWAEALACFEEAIGLSDVVLAQRYTEPGKEAEVAENRALYGPAAYCLVRLGRPAEALMTVERGKVRMLSEALTWKEIGDVGSEASSEGAGEAMAWARKEILRIEAESRQADVARDAERSARLGRQLRDAYRHMASLQAGAGGKATGDIGLDAILAEIPPGGALVVPVVTTHGGVAFVVPAGSNDVLMDHVLDLDDFNVRSVAALLSGASQDGRGGWLNAYLAWRNDSAKFDGLLAALHELAIALWTSLMGPVAGRLESLGVATGSHVVLMPSGWLGLLPLHAAHRPVDGRWRAFVEDFVVSYAPSMRAVRACRRRLTAEQRRGSALAAVANPTRDLRFAETEVATVEQLFATRGAGSDGTRVIPGDSASRAAVVAALPGRQYVHFACHAEFHWTDPTATGLRLAAGDWLRIEDVLSPAVDLRSSRLVTLSACETGMSEFRTMPDEFIGLPGAFLEAGAPAVVSSLWPVDDASTSLLMAEFFRTHLSGVGAAASLQRAQTWLREATAERLRLADAYRGAQAKSGGADRSAAEAAHYYAEHPDAVPFAHPYYWAGFVLTGADVIPTAGSNGAV